MCCCLAISIFFNYFPDESRSQSKVVKVILSDYYTVIITQRLLHMGMGMITQRLLHSDTISPKLKLHVMICNDQNNISNIKRIYQTYIL